MRLSFLSCIIFLCFIVLTSGPLTTRNTKEKVNKEPIKSQHETSTSGFSSSTKLQVEEWEMKLDSLSKKVTNQLHAIEKKLEKVENHTKKHTKNTISHVESLQQDMKKLRDETRAEQSMLLENDEKLRQAIEKLKHSHHKRGVYGGIYTLFSSAFDTVVEYSTITFNQAGHYIMKYSKKGFKITKKTFHTHIYPIIQTFQSYICKETNNLYRTYAHHRLTPVIDLYQTYFDPYYVMCKPYIDNVYKIIASKCKIYWTIMKQEHHYRRQKVDLWLDQHYPAHAKYASKAIDITLILLAFVVAYQLCLLLIRFVLFILSTIGNLLCDIFLCRLCRSRKMKIKTTKRTAIIKKAQAAKLANKKNN